MMHCKMRKHNIPDPDAFTYISGWWGGLCFLKYGTISTGHHGTSQLVITSNPGLVGKQCFSSFLMENLFIAQAYTSEGVVENGCPSFVMPLTIKHLAWRHLWHMTRNLVNNLKVPKLWVADRREPGGSNTNHCQTLGKELLFWNDEYSSRWCKLVQTSSWLCDNKWNTMELCGAWFDSELCYCFSVLLRSVYILPKRLPFVKAICTQGRRVVLDSWGPKVSDILGGSRSWQHLEHFGFSIFGTFWRSKPCSNLHAALIHWRWPWVPTFCIATGLKQAVQIVSFFLAMRTVFVLLCRCIWYVSTRTHGCMRGTGASSKAESSSLSLKIISSMFCCSRLKLNTLETCKHFYRLDCKSLKHCGFWFAGPSCHEVNVSYAYRSCVCAVIIIAKTISPQFRVALLGTPICGIQPLTSTNHAGNNGPIKSNKYHRANLVDKGCFKKISKDTSRGLSRLERQTDNHYETLEWTDDVIRCWVAGFPHVPWFAPLGLKDDTVSPFRASQVVKAKDSLCFIYCMMSKSWRKILDK